MGKRTKAKPNVDYRHRWPTQQTLVESWLSAEPPTTSRWRRKWHTEWLPRLMRRSSPEPGKSTHPYDTGVDDHRSSSRSSSESSSTVNKDVRRCWRLFAHTPHVPSSPLPTAKSPRIMEEQPRQELSSVPTQYLRLLTPRKSPLPQRQATNSPFDSEKAAVRSARLIIPTPTPTPPAPPPTVNCPIVMLSAKYESFTKDRLRRRGADPDHASGS